MFTVVLTIILAFLIAAIAWWYLQYYHYYSGMKGVQGSPPVPIIGHAIHVKNTMDAYFQMNTYVENFGTIVKICAGTIFGLLIIEPEVVECIMSEKRTINKGRIYRFLTSWLGTGLLTSSNQKWRSRRKLLTPAYHFKILEQFIEVFDKNSGILIRKLKSRVKDEQINIHPVISLCALDVIAETAMGTSINAQDDEESAFVRATKEMNRIVVERAVNIWKQYDLIYWFTEDYTKEKEALNVIHNYTMAIIKDRRDNLIIEKKEDQSKVDDLGIKKRIPFLDLLLLSSVEGEPLSNADIQEEVNTFMFEGHDTVSAGISFCLYLISKHPDVQTKILNEQKVLFGQDRNRPTTYQDLQDMKYLEMVIKEGLRLYPPVPLITRNTDEEFTFKNLTFRKGTEVGLFAYSLHRSNKFYENPEVFDPERFTPENQSKRHPFSYIPFSGGYRNCIGQKFAMLELKSVLSKLVRNFKILEVPNYEVELKSEIILSSRNGVMIKLDNRTWE